MKSSQPPMTRLDHRSWTAAVTVLTATEPSFVPLVERFPGERIQTSGDAFQVLANSIVGQQISVKAASAIFGRLTALLGEWSPLAVAQVSDEALRTAGLSARKVEYFRGL